MPFQQRSGQQQPAFPLSRRRGILKVRGIARKLMPIEELRALYRRVRRKEGDFFGNLLREMRVTVQLSDADRERIPATGPVVVVANHPFGMMDGSILQMLLQQVRPDVKILTNFLLADFPELSQHCIFVDPFGGSGAREANRRGLREAVEWLKSGGMLGVFPAGEVSHLRIPHGVEDPKWNNTAARLVRSSGADALPVYFCGHNSMAFHVLGLVHPRLRTLRLVSEFLNQRGGTFEVRVGSTVPGAKLQAMPSDREGTEYLRWRTYLLAQRGQVEPTGIPAAMRAVLPRRSAEPIAPEVPKPLVVAEIEKLMKTGLLDETRDFAVVVAQAEEAPCVIQELGRLREVTFRAVGEGTGQATDLDRFDAYYSQLLLWSKENQELVGAYRLGDVDKIVAEHGISGLYTRTCFRYDERLLARIGPALELGRSFVRPEYQRQFAPLMMLWKGIGKYLAKYPQSPVLFGAVSISSSYTRASRDLMVSYFQSQMAADDLRALVKPRHPFRPGRLRQWDSRAVSGLLKEMKDLDDLSSPISDMEADHKGAPILFKQYVKLGGRFLGFGVDANFSDSLDGLVVVDVRETDPQVLMRYMGKSEALGFLKFHGVKVEARKPAAVSQPE